MRFVHFQKLPVSYMRFVVALSERNSSIPGQHVGIRRWSVSSAKSTVRKRFHTTDFEWKGLSDPILVDSIFLLEYLQNSRVWRKIAVDRWEGIVYIDQGVAMESSFRLCERSMTLLCASWKISRRALYICSALNAELFCSHKKFLHCITHVTTGRHLPLCCRCLSTKTSAWSLNVPTGGPIWCEVPDW